MMCLAPASHAALQTFAVKVRAHLEREHGITDMSDIPESFDWGVFKEQEVHTTYTVGNWYSKPCALGPFLSFQVELLAKRDRFESASVASDYVLAVAITYAFTIMLTALYAFVSLCCCPNNW